MEISFQCRASYKGKMHSIAGWHNALYRGSQDRFLEKTCKLGLEIKVRICLVDEGWKVGRKKLGGLGNPGRGNIKINVLGHGTI